MNYTPKQLEILKLIYQFQNLHGYSPTYAELASHLKVSTITVFEHLTALERKNAVQRRRHEARSIEIVDRDFIKKVEDDAAGGKKSGSMPLVGRIAAGSPIEAVEDRTGVDIAGLFETSGECYMLEVRGDSMIDDHICDGDMVVVEKRDSAENGDVVVALLDDGSATLKRFYREPSGVRLQPANSSMEPIRVKNVHIQGVVKGVIRKCR
jgi:repressor LexA